MTYLKKLWKWLLPVLVLVTVLGVNHSGPLPEEEQQAQETSCLTFGNTVVREILTGWDVELLRQHARHSALVDEDVLDDFANYRDNWGSLTDIDNQRCAATHRSTLLTRRISATYAHLATFSQKRKPVRVQMALVLEDGAWRIEGVGFMSP